MKPIPYMPGVPAAGHIAGGFWHPGRIEGCPKCPPPSQPTPRPTPRRTLVRDLGAACPRCEAGLSYLTVTGVLSVHCDACPYWRVIAWQGGVVTTYEPAPPQPPPERGAP